jgi:ketol-acid reductoisomerase
MNIFTERDADPLILMGRTVGILGYGHLGRPVAWNLRDSGVDVRVGCHSRDSASFNRAIDDGFLVGLYEDIAQEAAIKWLMLPEEIMPQVYMDRVFPHLRRGDTLAFASGYNLTFGFIEPPPTVDVVMIAPRIGADSVRERFLDGRGFYSMVAVGQDTTSAAWATCLALARAAGMLKLGAVEVTIEQEAHLDLFLQQAIIPAVYHIFTTAAQVLSEAGYPDEAAMMDLYISGELNEVMHRAEREGLLHAVRKSTSTAQFGMLTRLERYQDMPMQRIMTNILRDIRSGAFASEWQRENADGQPRLRRMLRAQEALELWELEQHTLDRLKRLRDVGMD